MRKILLLAFASLALLTGGVQPTFSAGCGADVCIGDSWQAAYADAAPGSVLTVQAGTHQAQVFSPVAGKSGPAVVFKPAGGAVTVAGGITSGKSGGSVTTATGAPHIELDDMTVQGEIALRWGSDDWTLRNVTARNIRLTSVSDIRVLGGSYGPFTNQVATINSAGGSAPGVFNILIDGAAFHDYTINDPAKHAECMQIWPSAASSDITIKNTSFRNCTDFGVLVKAPNLTNMVFDTVTLDAPMPGNEATVLCNPDCPRGGSSIRFSTHPYPGAKVINSRMAGALAIDVPGYVTVTGGCSNCDPGGVTPPPPPACSNGKDDDGDGLIDFPADKGCTSATGTDETDPAPPACPGSSLPLRKVSEDATTVTFGWDPPAGAAGYRFSRAGYPLRPHTWDGTRSTVRFAKGSACYRVEALGVIADGGIAG